MTITTLPRAAVVLSILMGGVNAAEMNPQSTWILSTDLPEKKQNVDLCQYTPIFVMESHSPICLLKEIMVEVMPITGKIAHAFGVATDDPTSQGGARRPAKIAINFTPTKPDFVEVMKNFIEAKFGKEDVFGFGSYKFTARYTHANSRRYCCVSFNLSQYMNVGTVLDHLAIVADLSEADRVVFNQAYKEIEACAIKVIS